MGASYPWTLAMNAHTPPLSVTRPQTVSTTSRLLRLKNVIAPDGPIPVSKSTLYAWIAAGHFPKPHKIGKRASAWLSDDVEHFIQIASEKITSTQKLMGGAK